VKDVVVTPEEINDFFIQLNRLMKKLDSDTQTSEEVTTISNEDF